MLRAGNHQWFQIKEVAPGVYAIEESGHVQSYLVNGETCSALIDTGAGLSNIREAVQPLLRHRVMVLNTHWHFDHIGGNVLFKEIGISEIEKHLMAMDLPNHLLMGLYIRPCLEQGIPLPAGFVPEKYGITGTEPTFLIQDGDHFDLGGRTIRAIFTPGHTRGSMSFFDDLTGSLFCGDLLYQGTLYAHFEDSDLKDYQRSLKKLLDMPVQPGAVFGGHNAYPLKAEFILQVHRGLEMIEAGERASEVNNDWGEPAQAYHFEEFDLLTKMPGSPGVRLFDHG